MSALGSGHFTLMDNVVVSMGWKLLLSGTILGVMGIEEIDITVGD